MSRQDPFEDPKQIGRYRVIRRIGEGGMGIVFEAEQNEPVRRRVAIKIMKIGMDTREIVRRFEAERQALAVMEHPGIATVLDAGVSEDGRPYFVMELVHGIRLDEFCDRERLTIRQRVDLFVEICDAVQHAHQKGVIHRDLKPSNILVTTGRDGPHPRIIDFGVAKATGQRLTEETVVTRMGQAMGTLAYMSPEQADAAGTDVDTRSDIYALGVVLYEILVGVIPLDPMELGGPAFFARLIQRNLSAPTPLRRLTTLPQPEQRAVARCRQTNPRSLRAELRSDLQWIVVKAMDEARDRRYETASALADDLRRFLRDEPVAAHPPSTFYRTRKFVERHTGGVAAGAVVVVALTSATIATYQSRNRALESEQLALAEAERAEAVNQFLVELLGSADPTEEGREVRVVDVLDRASINARDRFDDTPVSEGSVRLALGSTYHGLGLYEEAARELSRSVELYRALDDPALTDALVELGKLKTLTGDFDEAREAHEEALAIHRTRDGERSPGVAEAMSGIGELEWYRGEYAAAAELFQEAIDIYQEDPEEHAEELIYARANLSVALHELGDLESAVRLDREALDGMKALLGPDHVDVATMSGNLAITLRRLGRTDEIEPLILDALRIFRQAYGDESDRVARALNNLGVFYRGEDRLAEAEEVLAEALTINTRVHGGEHHEIASNLRNLGLVRFDLGDHEGAIDLYARALAMNEQVRPEHPSVPESRTSLGWAYVMVGRLEEAEELLREARKEHVAMRGEDYYEVANIDSLLGECLRRMGRLEESEELLTEALPRLRRVLADGDPIVQRTMQHLDSLYRDLGDPARAREFRATSRANEAL